MNRWHQQLAAIAVVVIAAITVLVLAPSNETPQAAANETGPAELSLNVVAAANVTCIPVSNPDSCRVDLGTQFTLTAGIDAAPAEGFSGFQIDVVHAGLVSKDVRFVVPVDFSTTFGIIGLGTEEFLAGAVTSLSSPIPLSTYLGPLLEADLNCPVSPAVFTIIMPVPDSNVVNQFAQLITVTTVQRGLVKVADTLTINCSDVPAKQPFPGDTDGDGCPDERENLPESSALQGGGRDWLDPYDFYDVNGDGVVDLFNDILGVISHYSLDGNPPYEAAYDRGPTTGPNAWNMTEPDGIIDLFTDILGVIAQHSTNCN